MGTREKERIYSFYDIDKKLISKMFYAFDKSLSIDAVVPIHSGMSTSNYCVTVGQINYLLKVYSGGSRSIESAMYEYLEKYIQTPKLYYYDDTLKICPYPYAIIEYIQGETLFEYIRNHQCYPKEIVFEIGRMLSLIHTKKYPVSGNLNKELNLLDNLNNTKEFINSMLEGKPGSLLSETIKDKLREYITINHDIIDQIDADYVLCHGDIGYGNILISNGKVYFIDFEYAMAASPYRDIGKFFRRKEQDIQQYIDSSIYEAFANGYGGLPLNWLQLAKIADIPVMLGLLNVDNAPREWVADIEYDILKAVCG